MYKFSYFIWYFFQLLPIIKINIIELTNQNINNLLVLYFFNKYEFFNFLSEKHIFLISILFYFSILHKELSWFHILIINLFTLFSISKQIAFLLKLRKFLFFITTLYFFLFLIRGFYLKFKGKLGVRGNLRKRQFKIIWGKFSLFNKINRFKFKSNIIKTSTGTINFFFLVNYN